ncbi:hypothetical protein C4K01_0712 [Pseudomonas synxantha]|nr:hypothetical protein C4K01_0712 [Pseudomonas synxantha]
MAEPAQMVPSKSGPPDSVKKPARASDAFCKLLHKSITTIKYLFI